MKRLIGVLFCGLLISGTVAAASVSKAEGFSPIAEGFSPQAEGSSPQAEGSSPQAEGSLQIFKLEEGVYLHVSYMRMPEYGLVSSNGLVYVDQGDAYIIDTPWPEADTKKLMAWIAAQGWQLKASIATHYHADRASGIATLNAAGIATFASQHTNQLLAEHEQPQAAQVFSSHEFSFVPGKIEVFYPGAGHTADNLVVWLAQSKILVGGCLIRAAAAQGMGNTADAVSGAWAASVRAVLHRFPHADRVVPGHGIVGSKSLLTHTIDLAEAQFGKSEKD